MTTVTPSQTSEFLRIAGSFFPCGPELSFAFCSSRPFTIEGWIGFSANLHGTTMVLSKPGELTLGLLPRGQLFVEHPAWRQTLVGRTALKPGIWSHVGVTFDGTSIELYVHGIRDARGFVHSAASALHDPASPELLPFAGEAWDLRCWNVAWTAPEMFRATWVQREDSQGLVANFFPELPPPERRKLGRTDNPPRLPLAA